MSSSIASKIQSKWLEPETHARVPVEHLADLAGHADPRVTMAVYRHQLTTAVDAGADLASALFNSSRSGVN